MLKTPIRKRIVSRLEALNDQLCFLQFSGEELIRSIGTAAAPDSQSFTTEAYPLNPLAARIHVRLSELPSFHASTGEFTFGAYASTSYEVASDFFEQATEAISNYLGAPAQPPAKVKGGPEDQYRELLKAHGLSLPRAPWLETMSYVRYRRNAFIHLATTVVPAYQTLVAASGSGMNAHWGPTRAPLDLSVPSIGAFGDAETFTVLKLLRICIIELDQHLAGLLPPQAVARALASRLFSREAVRMNALVAAERSKQLSAALDVEYGASVTLEQARAIVSEVGIL